MCVFHGIRFYFKGCGTAKFCNPAFYGYGTFFLALPTKKSVKNAFLIIFIQNRTVFEHKYMVSDCIFAMQTKK